MAVDQHTSEGRRIQKQQLHWKGGFATETLGADLQLTKKSAQVLKLDPGGSHRNVDLPGVEENLDDSDGMWFQITNAASGAEDLIVRDPAEGTVVTLSQNELALVFGTGVENWDHAGIVSIAPA